LKGPEGTGQLEGETYSILVYLEYGQAPVAQEAAGYPLQLTAYA
jgi:hypothetical protein